MGKPFVPFVSCQFAFKRYEHDIAKRTFTLFRVAPQALMQGIWDIFDLEICHGMNMACFQHAVKGQSPWSRMPSNYRLSASGYLSKIDQMHLAVRECLWVPPSEVTA
jgi:hypothetical protein